MDCVAIYANLISSRNTLKGAEHERKKGGPGQEIAGEFEYQS
jgi:hypothetical protein